MKLKDRILSRPCIFLGYLFIMIWGFTLRIRKKNVKFLEFQREPAIFIIWHSEFLLPAYIFRYKGHHVLISEHRDGEFIARIVKKLGFNLIRGSSTRGGLKALKHIIRLLNQGINVVITPDGPKGPPRKIQKGTLQASVITGYPIIPVASFSKWKYRFNSWDRFSLALPFSKSVLLLGKPVFIQKGFDLDRKRVLIERTMCRLEKLAKRMIC